MPSDLTAEHRDDDFEQPFHGAGFPAGAGAGFGARAVIVAPAAATPGGMAPSLPGVIVTANVPSP
ncbi:MAG TPA: hypothetical protein VMU87_01350 [Stellaceae bacterium]|nr:hypothetical protein [Stellaceae bacterium]